MSPARSAVVPRRRLLVRLYLVGLAQIVVVVSSIPWVFHLRARAMAPHGLDDQAHYVAAQVLAHVDDPVALHREVMRVHDVLHADVSVYDGAQTLVATSVDPPLHPSRPPPSPPLPWPSLRGPRPPFEITIPVDGADRSSGPVVVVRPHGLPPPGLPTVWILLVALIAVGVSSVAFARTLAQPLGTLAQTARAFGSGDLKARTRMVRQDEFGEVAAAFDDMADRVAALIRAQRQLLADVSHEVRTPLARIRVALDLADEGGPQAAGESLAEIGDDLAEIERLVHDLLQNARLDLDAERSDHGLPIARSQRVEVRALIDRCVTRARRLHPSRAVEVQAAQVLGALDADAVLLHRALDNILDNAVKYSDSETTVTVRASRVDDTVRVDIIDRGIGIEPEALEHIGTPFFRTDRSRARKTGGVGLGLSLARRIVAAHDGSLTLASAPGEGTTVTLTLPVQPPEAPMSAAQRNPETG